MSLTLKEPVQVRRRIPLSLQEQVDRTTKRVEEYMKNSERMKKERAVILQRYADLAKTQEVSSTRAISIAPRVKLEVPTYGGTLTMGVQENDIARIQSELNEMQERLVREGKSAEEVAREMLDSAQRKFALLEKSGTLDEMIRSKFSEYIYNRLLTKKAREKFGSLKAFNALTPEKQITRLKETAGINDIELRMLVKAVQQDSMSGTFSFLRNASSNGLLLVSSLLSGNYTLITMLWGAKGVRWLLRQIAPKWVTTAGNIPGWVMSKIGGVVSAIPGTQWVREHMSNLARYVDNNNSTALRVSIGIAMLASTAALQAYALPLVATYTGLAIGSLSKFALGYVGTNMSDIVSAGLGRLASAVGAAETQGVLDWFTKKILGQGLLKIAQGLVTVTGSGLSWIAGPLAGITGGFGLSAIAAPAAQMGAAMILTGLTYSGVSLMTTPLWQRYSNRIKKWEKTRPRLYKIMSKVPFAVDALLVIGHQQYGGAIIKTAAEYARDPAAIAKIRGVFGLGTEDAQEVLKTYAEINGPENGPPEVIQDPTRTIEVVTTVNEESGGIETIAVTGNELHEITSQVVPGDVTEFVEIYQRDILRNTMSMAGEDRQIIQDALNVPVGDAATVVTPETIETQDIPEGSATATYQQNAAEMFSWLGGLLAIPIMLAGRRRLLQ